MFRLLSPLLNIFFGYPNRKKFRSQIHSLMKNEKIDLLKNLFLKFVDNQQLKINY